MSDLNLDMILKLKGIQDKSFFNIQPNYVVNVTLRRFVAALRDYGELLIDSSDSDYKVVNKMTPDFQRDNTKWDLEMQTAFVQNVICGCQSEIMLYQIGEPDRSLAECYILDGLQRTTAMCRFLNGEYPVFNDMYFSDINSTRVLGGHNLKLRVYTFSSHVEACEFYIQMNKNITHSPEDLLSANKFLENSNEGNKIENN